MSVVVDASLVVALVVTDERQQAVQTQLAGWLHVGEELHAPGVLPCEIANVLARLVFDGSFEGSDVAEVWRDLADLGLVLHPFDLNHDGAEVAVVTARLRRRHATDSTYVCLAQRLGARRCGPWTAHWLATPLTSGCPLRSSPDRKQRGSGAVGGLDDDAFVAGGGVVDRRATRTSLPVSGGRAR